MYDRIHDTPREGHNRPLAEAGAPRLVREAPRDLTHELATFRRRVVTLEHDLKQLREELHRLETAERQGVRYLHKDDLRPLPEDADAPSGEELDDWLHRVHSPETYQTRLRDRLRRIDGELSAAQGSLTHTKRRTEPPTWRLDTERYPSPFDHPSS